MLHTKRQFTPLFNTRKSISFLLSVGRTNPQQIGKALETMLFKGTLVQFVEGGYEDCPEVLKVRTNEYPYGEFYTLGYFFRDEEKRGSKGVRGIQRVLERQIPKLEYGQIHRTLKNVVGTPYLWGGNTPQGCEFEVPSLRERGKMQRVTSLRGMDCSGLLYYATNGATPRNTETLRIFGTAVSIPSSSWSMIRRVLRGLDLILFPGHIAVCAGKHVYESRQEYFDGAPSGVRQWDIKEYFSWLLREYYPVKTLTGKEGEFCIRRWHPDMHN